MSNLPYGALHPIPAAILSPWCTIPALQSIAIRALFFLLLAILSCGSNRQLQSVTIQPATADAKSFRNGQVQFTATGIFSGSSVPVRLTSKDVTWCYGGTTAQASSPQGICEGGIAQFAGVDQNGIAECSPTFQGSVYILAGTPARSANPDGATQLTVYGAEQLTCP